MECDYVPILLSLQPYLDTLKDGSTLQRGAKKTAIEKVKQIAFQGTTNWCSADQVALFDELLDPIFLWSTSDIEYIREKAVLLLQCYVERTDEPKDKVVQTCMHRFPSEPTEEIRQVWMNVILTMIRKLTKKVKPPMDDVWFGLATLAVTDPCPQVIKQGADLVVAVATLQPKAVGYRGEHTIINSVLPLLTHKHTATRILGTKVRPLHNDMNNTNCRKWSEGGS
ncbi:hypothetical protein BCR42DRAFT_80031 [Absidia repens]|uniref:Dynein axonemal assembly factor 5 TPR repeats domain-containing protein n=1 Tax=Absidia repens TaxID=90262 RepID=A0A1X2I9E9_9FUNG|nr:hypothetical protein BCR42DRAFT_80031 [Absidia repens]